jgi:hypothetical protein
MLSSGMLRRVTLVRTDISEIRFGSIIRVTRIGEIFLRSVLRLLVTPNVISSSPSLITLMIEEILSSETSVLTRATRRKIPEDGLLRNHSASTNLRCIVSSLAWQSKYQVRNELSEPLSGQFTPSGLRQISPSRFEAFPSFSSLRLGYQNYSGYRITHAACKPTDLCTSFELSSFVFILSRNWRKRPF